MYDWSKSPDEVDALIMRLLECCKPGPRSPGYRPRARRGRAIAHLIEAAQQEHEESRGSAENHP